MATINLAFGISSKPSKATLLRSEVKANKKAAIVMAAFLLALTNG